MTTFLGCIADDFTGATDLASMLARSGVNVSLRIGVPLSTPENTAEIEVIALKTRSISASKAIEESLSALKWLKEAGAKKYFFKYCSTFDSTAEGNIGPVSEALMNELKVDQTIYCPAFPENGRSIYMGNLFVGQKLLSESSMKDHPLTPMNDSNLMRLLSAQVSRRVGLADRIIVNSGVNSLKEKLISLKENDVPHVIVDAVADTDLDTIASACQDMDFITGGSALAMPLAEFYKASGKISANDNSFMNKKLNTGSIILSGSCSEMTIIQVKNFIQRGAAAFQLDPIDLAENGIKKVLDWLSSQDFTKNIIIYATSDPYTVKKVQAELGVDMAGKIVEQGLSECAIAARELGIKNFIIAGGETSGAITKALNVRQLDIGIEIAPGVPWTFSGKRNNQIALSLKSGNFGSEEFFTEALSKLENL
ncbi:four-carbon acid sugar kinase family protein [Amylibacter sp.]|nr:four-carbon acid sugar kinase family protein [Amylibacter sp.]MDA8802548.1 four-carbon acid sugar kinase family protein [Amylibacter sp.]